MSFPSLKDQQPPLICKDICMFAKDIRVMTNCFLTLEMYNFV